MTKSNSGLYYKKDKKAQIYKKINIFEPGDMPKYAYAPRSPSLLWCYTSQLTQQGLYYAHTYGDDETRLFVFNYDAKIDFDQLVLYRDVWYLITRVDTKDDYNGELFVYVKNAIGGYIPEKYFVYEYDPKYWDD